MSDLERQADEVQWWSTDYWPQELVFAAIGHEPRFYPGIPHASDWYVREDRWEEIIYFLYRDVRDGALCLSKDFLGAGRTAKSAQLTAQARLDKFRALGCRGCRTKNPKARCIEEARRLTGSPPKERSDLLRWGWRGERWSEEQLAAKPGMAPWDDLDHPF
jgi:hypothetical protein